MASKHDDPKHDEQGGKPSEHIKHPTHRVGSAPTVHGKLVRDTQNAYVVADADGNEVVVPKEEGVTLTEDQLVVSGAVDPGATGTTGATGTAKS